MILAGAPLAGLAARVRDRVSVPVVDQMAAAVKQAETLVTLGVRKATVGTFRRPDASNPLWTSRRPSQRASSDAIDDRAPARESGVKTLCHHLLRDRRRMCSFSGRQSAGALIRAYALHSNAPDSARPLG